MARRKRASRTGRAWIPGNPRRALVLCAGALVLAYFAGTMALAESARDDNPELVMRVVPFDAKAPLIAVEHRLGDKAGPETVAARREASLQSLRRQAVNPAGLRVLAFADAIQKRDAEATRLLRLSEKMSRHDVRTQLWLIEDAVRRDDYRDALEHYDRALRTNVAMQPTLFQVLLSALSDEQVRSALVPYIRANPRWAVMFLLEATNSDPTAADGARLMLAAGPAVSARTTEMIAPQLLTRLARIGELDLAYRYFLGLKGADPALVQRAGFDAATVDPRFSAFAWTALQEARAGAGFEAGRGDGRQVRVFANPEAGGVVLRRLLRLPPGAYKFTESRQVQISDPGAEAYWLLKCAEPGTARTIWRTRASPVAYRAKDASGPVIPGDCPWQTLELAVDSGEGQQGLEFVIEDFRLTR